jgi:dipeptidyl aminopeptidase/acylaminoacyl peptidase
MNERSDISRVLQHWFDDGPSTMPDRVVDVVADRIARESQRRPWRRAWTGRRGIRPGLAFAAVVVLLIVALVAAALIGGSPPFVPPRVAPAIQPLESAPVPTPAQTATPFLGIGPGLILVEVANLRMPNELRYIAPDKRALPFLPDFGGHQRAAAWRPDGQRLAFAGRPDGHPDQWMDLYETLPDGTSPTLLSTDCEPPACVDESDPAYSPNGSKIVAVRQADLRDGTPTRVVLVILDLATGESTEIPGTSYPYDTYDIGHPRWSPDGTRIAFHVVEGPPSKRRLLIFPEPTSPGPSSIYVVGTDGSGLRQLTPDGVPAGDPDWSPDGSLIVFGPTSLHLWLYGQNQAAWRIQAIRPDGTDLRVIIPGPDAATPSWTAGGAQILFTQQDVARQVIRIADPDGSDVRDVATFPSTGEIEMYPVQQPTP